MGHLALTTFQRLVILSLSIYEVSCNWTATLRIESPHQSGGQYYVFPGSSVTLVCEHPGLSVSNRDYILLDRGPPGDPPSDRIYSVDGVGGTLAGRAIASSSDTGVFVTITQFDQSQDSKFYICRVCQTNLVCSNAVLNLATYVLVPPTNIQVSLTSPSTNWITENRPFDVVCEATFTSTDVSGLSFALTGVNKVGALNPSSGTSTSVRYTVNAVTFDGSQTPTITCQVIWQNDKPGIKISKPDTPVEKQLVVYFPPSTNDLTPNPSGSVVQNTPVTVTCNVGNSKHAQVTSVKWTRDGRTVSGADSSTSGTNGGKTVSSELSFTAQKSDNGKNVTCTPVWNGQEQTALRREHTIDVLFTVTSITMTGKSNGFSNENGAVTLVCSTDESNPVADIVWKRGNTAVTTGVTADTLDTGIQYNGVKRQSKLSFSAKRSDNGAVFTCSVSGKEALNDADTLQVKFAPQVSNLVVNPTGDVKVGATVIFTCDVGTSNNDPSSPSTIVRWTRGSRTVIGTDTPSSGQYGGQVISSILSIIAEKSDNGQKVTCTPVWNGQDQNALKKEITVTVLYPAEVSVQGQGEVTENAALSLTCNINVAGNPNSYTYTWQFRSRYNAQNFVNLQNGNQNLRVENSQHTNAGVYKCTATNSGGSASGEKTVLVKYRPIDVSASGAKTGYGSVGSEVSVNYTLRSFPTLETSHVTVTKIQGTASPSVTVSAVQGQTDQYMVKITFGSVKGTDFGDYSVMVNNAIGILPLSFSLSEQGPPGVPTDVQVSVVTAQTFVVTWRAGRSGGYTQTFQIHYRKASTSLFTEVPGLSDPGDGVQTNYTVSSLTEQTVYEFKVVAVNGYNSDSNTAESGPITVQTIALPVITGTRQAVVSGNTVTFTLPSISGNFTRIVIEKCSGATCEVIQELTVVPSSSELTLPISNAESFTYRMFVYQHHDEVYKNEFTSKTPTGGGNIPIIVGAVMAVVVLAVVAVIGLVFFRRNSKGPHKAPATLERDIVEIGGAPSNPPDYSDNQDNNGSAPVYAQVQKGEKKKANKPQENQSPVYAEVVKSGKKNNKAKDGDQGVAALYAAVDTKNKKNKQKGKPEEGKKGKKLKKEKPVQDGAVYANTTFNSDRDFGGGDNMYANVNGQGAEASAQPEPVDDGRYVDSDGQTYVQVAFQPKPQVPTKPKPQVVEDRTVYAAIDFSKSGPPPEEE